MQFRMRHDSEMDKAKWSIPVILLVILVIAGRFMKTNLFLKDEGNVGQVYSNPDVHSTESQQSGNDTVPDVVKDDSVNVENNADDEESETVELTVTNSAELCDFEKITYTYGCPDEVTDNKKQIAETLRDLVSGNYPMKDDPSAIYVLPYGHNYLADVSYEDGSNLFFIVYYNQSVGAYRATQTEGDTTEFTQQMNQIEEYTYE